MTERIGLTITWTQFGLGVGPVVPFPATEADRQKAADEAGKAALLVSKVSAAQRALLRRLAEASPEGYLVPAASWIDTVLKATKGLTEADIERLHTFDWTPAAIGPEELRKKILAVLNKK